MRGGNDTVCVAVVPEVLLLIPAPFATTAAALFPVVPRVERLVVFVAPTEGFVDFVLDV